MLKIRVHERFNEVFNPKTVKIGDQVWMAENLDIDDGGEGITNIGGKCYYTWEAAKRISSTIPGWHLPTELNFVELCFSLGGKSKFMRTRGMFIDLDLQGAPFNLTDSTYITDNHTINSTIHCFLWSATKAVPGRSAYTLRTDNYRNDKHANYELRVLTHNWESIKNQYPVRLVKD